MSKQTAVQWLLNNLLINGLLRLTKDEHPLYKELKDHAKAMEREQIEEAYQAGDGDAYNLEETKTWAEQYYNSTYKGGEK
jgi:hypothetical protein